MKQKLNAGIVGSTGYTGREICRLLLNHKYVNKILPFARDENDFEILHPNLLGSGLQFIDINNLNLNENRIVALRKIKKGLSLLANSTPRYQCEECGFSSQKLLWQCPSCKQWETQRPFANVQFDSILQRKPLISD